MKPATPRECLEAMDAVNLLRDYFSDRELDPALWSYVSSQLHALHTLSFSTSLSGVEFDLSGTGSVPAERRA